MRGASASRWHVQSKIDASSLRRKGERAIVRGIIETFSPSESAGAHPFGRAQFKEANRDLADFYEVILFRPVFLDNFRMRQRFLYNFQRPVRFEDFRS